MTTKPAGFLNTELHYIKTTPFPLYSTWRASYQLKMPAADDSPQKNTNLPGLSN